MKTASSWWPWKIRTISRHQLPAEAARQRHQSAHHDQQPAAGRARPVPRQHQQRADQSYRRAKTTTEDEEEVDENDLAEDSPIAQTVNLIIEYGVKAGASDIHIEPREDLRGRPLPYRRHAARSQ